ncbi:MAG: hypothetical protein LKF99_05410 [Bifidobacterium sp.]|jgi:transposase-like protein|nr:hypothetical protein [Bifidobacterium sp.]
MAGYEYGGRRYPDRGSMLRASREHYSRLVNSGMSYMQAARTVGVSKQTG